MKEPIHKMKRQLMEWEEIFASHLSDKELIPKYIYNSCNSIVKKKYSVKKGAEEQNFLSREDTKNRHMKMCSTSLIIREYISKPQLDTTLYLLEWLSSKRQEVTNVGEDVEKREPSFTVGWGVQIWDTAIMETDSMEAPQKIKIRTTGSNNPTS